jgi:hypothetical protein
MKASVYGIRLDISRGLWIRRLLEAHLQSLRWLGDLQNILVNTLLAHLEYALTLVK